MEIWVTIWLFSMQKGTKDALKKKMHLSLWKSHWSYFGALNYSGFFVLPSQAAQLLLLQAWSLLKNIWYLFWSNCAPYLHTHPVTHQLVAKEKANAELTGKDFSFRTAFSLLCVCSVSGAWALFQGFTAVTQGLSTVQHNLMCLNCPVPEARLIFHMQMLQSSTRCSAPSRCSTRLYLITFRIAQKLRTFATAVQHDHR